MTDSGDVAQQRLAAIVGSERIRAATKADALDGIGPQRVHDTVGGGSLIPSLGTPGEGQGGGLHSAPYKSSAPSPALPRSTGGGREESPPTVACTNPRWIVEPDGAAGVAKTLACANELGLHIVARGGGTKIGWGAPPRSLDFILSTARLNRVIEHAAADMTATVQAGCTVESFQRALAAQNQRLALDPLWPDRATIGGILATNDFGSLRGGFGTLRDLLIGVTIALPDGTLARSGGKVVKNVAGYDLQKLMIGSFGTLAVIVEATFRLHPLPLAFRNVRCTVPSDRLAKLAGVLNELSLLMVSAQITMDGSPSIELALRVESVPEAIEHKCRSIRTAMEPIGIQMQDRDADFCAAREKLFDLPDATVCRLALLPSHWPDLHAMLAQENSHREIRGSLIAQAAGGGLLALSGPDSAIVNIIMELRERLAVHGGSAVILKCPPEFKDQLDIWGAPGDSLALMKRIKSQFDQNNILRSIHD